MQTPHPTRGHIPLDERLIVALDLPDRAGAEALVELLAPTVRYFKVGLELFLAEGFPMVQSILDRGCKIMLDLKFYDVPNTVAAAVRQVVRRGVSLATLHGDPAILRAAAQAAQADARTVATPEGAPPPCGLLAVTALTSLSQEDLQAMGYSGEVEDLVLQRAALAKAAGLWGVVCSPREIVRLRRELGPELCIVTPGIRPADAAADDQKRTATPGRAMADGADHIVVGRPIRLAPDPLAMARRIQEEIATALG